MKYLVFLVLLFNTSSALAVGPPVPDEFIGKWVILDSSCRTTKIGLNVEKEYITLFNGSDSIRLGDLDLCYSCEGGVRYSGYVVWLTPEFNSSDHAKLTVYFNAKEEKGIAMIEFEQDDLRNRFPLHNVKLRKCK